MLNHSMKIRVNPITATPESAKIQKLREKMNYAERNNSNPNIEDSTKQPSFLAGLSASPVTPLRSVIASSHNDSYVNQGDFYVNNFNSLSNSTQNTNYYGEMSLSEITPQNGKEKALKDILVRLHKYKCNWQNVKRIFASFQTKVQLKNPFYYDYLNERDDLTLKILIQILYEEMDNMANFLEQSTTTQKERVENMEKIIHEKEHVLSKLAEELVNKNTYSQGLQERLDEAHNQLSAHSDYFSELGLSFQAILEELSGPALAFNDEKKKRLINMINKILGKLPTVLTANDNTPQKKRAIVKMDEFGNLTTGVKREMTFADLITLLNKEGIVINDYDNEPKPVLNLFKTHSEPEESVASPVFKTPPSVLKRDRDSKWFSPDRAMGVVAGHKKCVSFQDAFTLKGLSDEKGFAQYSPSNDGNFEAQYMRRIEELEIELNNAKENIARLLEENQSAQGEVQKLRIQKGELVNKIHTYENNLNFNSTMAMSTCESPHLMLESPQISSISNVGNVQEMKDKLKKSEDISRLLISQYENKILDSIEKYEELKGLCNLILMTGDTIEQSKSDQSPAQWRALKTEFERKRDVLRKKVKDLEREQEMGRSELKKLAEEEEFLTEFYGTQKQDKSNTIENIENKKLKEENNDLNGMVKSLASEITSLKSQLRMMTAVEEHRRSSNSSMFESRVKTPKYTPKQTPSNSFCNLDEEEKPKSSVQANQTDLLYMLGAQATAIEAFLH